MSWSLRNKATNSSLSSDTTIAVTLTGTNVQSGDLLVVWTSNGSDQVMSVSDGTNTLTPLTQNNRTGLDGQWHYRLTNQVTGLPTYTCTFGAPTNATNRTIHVYVVTPTGTVSFDQEGGDNSAVGTSYTSLNLPNTTGTDEIVFGGVSSSVDQTFSAQSVNSSAADDHQETSFAATWYKTFTSTITGETTATGTVSANWVCSAAAFKISGGTAFTLTANSGSYAISGIASTTRVGATVFLRYRK